MHSCIKGSDECTEYLQIEYKDKLIQLQNFLIYPVPLTLHTCFLSPCYYKSFAEGVFILLQQISHSRELENPDRHLAAGSASRTLRALLSGSQREL